MGCKKLLTVSCKKVLTVQCKKVLTVPCKKLLTMWLQNHLTTHSFVFGPDVLSIRAIPFEPFLIQRYIFWFQISIDATAVASGRCAYRILKVNT